MYGKTKFLNFSATFSTINEKHGEVSNTQRYRLMDEYFEASPTPPPLSIIYYLIIIIFFVIFFPFYLCCCDDEDDETEENGNASGKKRDMIIFNLYRK